LFYLLLLLLCIFTVGEKPGLQADQFSTQTLSLCSPAVVIRAECGVVLGSSLSKMLSGWQNMSLQNLKMFLGISEIFPAVRVIHAYVH